MRKVRLARVTVGGLAVCVAALGAMGFAACSSDSSRVIADDGIDAQDASVDRGTYDVWKPYDAAPGDADIEDGDGGSPSDAANDARDAGPDGGCMTSADCNDGGFGESSTMWCDHNNDNLTQTRPVGARCPSTPGLCKPLPAPASCVRRGGPYESYCGCDGKSHPYGTAECAHLDGTNVEYWNSGDGLGACP
jgi:hypothetical protein